MAAMQHTELHFTPARLLLLLWWNQHPQQSMSQFWCRQCLSTHFHRQVSRLAHLSQYISRQAFQFTVQTVFTFYSYELFQFPKFLHPDTAAWSCLTWRTQGNPFCEILAKHIKKTSIRVTRLTAFVFKDTGKKKSSPGSLMSCYLG